jgi:hypothetical protein
MPARPQGKTLSGSLIGHSPASWICMTYKRSRACNPAPFFCVCVFDGRVIASPYYIAIEPVRRDVGLSLRPIWLANQASSGPTEWTEQQTDRQTDKRSEGQKKALLAFMHLMTRMTSFLSVDHGNANTADFCLVSLLQDHPQHGFFWSHGLGVKYAVIICINDCHLHLR